MSSTRFERLWATLNSRSRDVIAVLPEPRSGWCCWISRRSGKPHGSRKCGAFPAEEIAAFDLDKAKISYHAQTCYNRAEGGGSSGADAA